MAVVEHSMIERWIAWLAHEAPRRLTPATIAVYQRGLVAFAHWLETTVGVPLQPTNITAYRVEQYTFILEMQVKHKVRKPATYNKLIAALSSFGTWLVETGACADNPARRLRAMAEQPAPPTALEPAMIGRLLATAHQSGNLRDALIIELLAHLGMRTSELAGIQLLSKGHKQRRVPLPWRISKIMQRYLDLRSKAEGQRPTSGPLLVGERGGITRTTINRTVKALAERAGLTENERALVTPNALRHSIAIQLVGKYDVFTAAELLGHSSLSTTRRYK